MIGKYGDEFYVNDTIISAMKYEHNQSLTNEAYISPEAVRYSQS
jgi:hypothetical protein